MRVRMRGGIVQFVSVGLGLNYASAHHSFPPTPAIFWTSSLQLNCETDFVAKRPEFAALAKSVAMQIAASPTVEFVSVSDIPPEVIEAERVLEMQSEDLAGKPDEIKAKMVEGRLQKILKTKCLMETAYIKDPTQTMEVVVKSAISTLGENIKVARFSRMELGA